MTNNRRIRVFVSSTFRDMVGERDELMTQAWPELRRFCRERQVELVEVDLRWGIAEEQSTRKETLKLCLDEIRACRPFFLGLLGERYGWVPGPDAFTADLREEQPWLADLQDRSVTELEIIHGVLREEQMHKRAFFYFRDPQYLDHLPPGSNRTDFETENPAAKTKLDQLKQAIRHARDEQICLLRENYSDPRELVKLVLEDLKAAIGEQFPIEQVPDPLTREARDHETFAEIRRRTYIGRPEYFETLDKHAAGDGGPLVLLGESGSGKSALLANWIEHWRTAHPNDFIFQHYIGGTPDSAEHWRLMTRLIAEIKRWSGDPDDVPRSHDDLLRDFTVWLAKARSKAAHDCVLFIVVLDALNQLDDRDHAHTLGWLPAHPFNGALRLIVSTLPGDTLEAVKTRGWQTLRVEPLTEDERRRMIAHYLERFGKKLDANRLERIAAAPAAANPLFLRILLDELRVTGTHEHLDERLNDYLSGQEIPALLKKVLARYQRDYERDRPGLVSEVLGLIWAARRGLTESELLRLLKPSDKTQLPPAIWNPLRAALEDSLVDRGGILNFAHDFFRTAVKATFVTVEDKRDELRLQLADFFEDESVTARNCDELPWLLWQTESFVRLRACLLDIDKFLEIHKRDPEELISYWVRLEEEQVMGAPYLASFEQWSRQPWRNEIQISHAANALAFYLNAAALDAEAEVLISRSLAIDEHSFGLEHPYVASNLSVLGELLRKKREFARAEPVMRRALAITEKMFGPDHPEVAINLNNLARLLDDTSRPAEAEPLYRRALAILENTYGPEHPKVATNLGNLGELLRATNRLGDAEPLMRRALAISEKSLGSNHPEVAIKYNNLAFLLRSSHREAEAESLYRHAIDVGEKSCGLEHPLVLGFLENLSELLWNTNRPIEAEPLMRRVLAVVEKKWGANHPELAAKLNNLAELLRNTGRLSEAELLYRRAITIAEVNFGPDHLPVSIYANNLAELLQVSRRPTEAEPLLRKCVNIVEKKFGPDDPKVAICLINLAGLLYAASQFTEAVPLMERVLEIFFKFTRSTGQPHPHFREAVICYEKLFNSMGRSRAELLVELNAIAKPHGIRLDGGK